MKDSDIDFNLAMAVGHKDVRLFPGGVFVMHRGRWHRFDHKEWNVVGPIATVLDCFPTQSYNNLWYYARNEYASDLPQKTIALEAIQLIKEEGLPK